MSIEALCEWATEVREIREWPEASVALAPWGEAVAERSQDKLDLDAPERTIAELNREIDRARTVFDSQSDWDHDGGTAYSAATFDRAAAFLRNCLRQMWMFYGVVASVPRIGPGPNGSIDIHWKMPAWELLINVPSETSELATFYGDDYGTQRVRGSFDLKDFSVGILLWLMR